VALETIAASGRRCASVCACVCVWSAILTTLTAGARLLYRARAFPLSQTGHPAAGTAGDLTRSGRRERYRGASIVDRRSCESVVQNPKGAIVFVYYNATKSACTASV